VALRQLVRTDRNGVARTARRIKNVPYSVKATKAKQPEPEIEVEDDLVRDDDDDLDFIDRDDK
jgi:hypothetical protein